MYMTCHTVKSPAGGSSIISEVNGSTAQQVQSEAASVPFVWIPIVFIVHFFGLLFTSSECHNNLLEEAAS